MMKTKSLLFTTLIALLIPLLGFSQKQIPALTYSLDSFNINNWKNTNQHPIYFKSLEKKKSVLQYVKVDFDRSLILPVKDTNNYVYLIYRNYHLPEKPTSIEGHTLINPLEAYQNNKDFWLPNALRFYQNLEFLDTVKMEGHNPDRFQSSQLANIPFYKFYKPFYIKNFEVTNGEYMEFVDWVRDSIARWMLADEIGPDIFLKDYDPRDSLKANFLDWNAKLDYHNDPEQREVLDLMYAPEDERFYGHKKFDTRKFVYVWEQLGKRLTTHIYPDTLCWREELGYTYGEPLLNIYFWHPAFKNYPIVGIDHIQAEAFCHWKTKQLQKIYGKNIIVRLPFEYERESTIRIAYTEENQFVQAPIISDYNWLCNTLTSNKDVYPQLDQKSNSMVLHHLFNRSNLLLNNFNINSNSMFFSDGYHQTTPADLTQIDEKKFVNKRRQKKRLYHTNCKTETERQLAYTLLMKDLTPNGISGLAGNVSEWMQESYDENWKAVFFMRQMQLKCAQGADAKLMSEIEEYFDYINHKQGQLIRGSNWFDRRNASFGEINVAGLNAKRFIDPNKGYSTVGFRYVIEILE